MRAIERCKLIKILQNTSKDYIFEFDIADMFKIVGEDFFINRETNKFEKESIVGER